MKRVIFSLFVAFFVLFSTSIALAQKAAVPRQINLSPVPPRETYGLTAAQWLKKPFGILTTELSPAALFHARGPRLLLFGDLEKWGLAGPSHVAVPTSAGVQVLRCGQGGAPSMAEPWLLCWFADSPGWNRWDAPVLVVLQHKPVRLALGEQGLVLEFKKEAGFVAVMPLFGYLKLPRDSNSDYRRKHGLPSAGLYTRKWEYGLPPLVANRCRFFSRVLRAFPVYCREEFALDGEDLVVRYTFEWLTINDDWRTPAQKFAPLPPVLALAWWAGENVASKPFPMQFSQTPHDADLFTPYGPYVGIDGVDSYTLRMHVLQYIQQAEVYSPPDLGAAHEAASALRRLRKTLARKFKTSDWQQIWDHGGPKNYCWQVMGDRWYAKAIPYLPPDVQKRVKGALVAYLREFILDEKHYKPFRGMLLLVGPGIGTWGGYDDAGKFSSNLLETIWNIGRYAGGWDVIKARWPMIKRFFITPLECDWKSVGRYAIAELGDEAAPPLAMARLAWRVGDYDTYAFASYVFARELVHHYVKQVGAPYYRLHQPYHSMEFMPKEVYLTNMWGDLAGWQIDGPTYPEKTGERQFNNRWVRFSCEEVGWFYQDVLGTEIRREMDLLTQRAREKKTPYHLLTDTAHIAPSILRLRALLLNEPAADLARICPPSRWRVGRAADVTAMCLCFLRNTHRVRRTLLIPRVKTNFVLGLERVRGSATHPAIAITIGRQQKTEGQGEPHMFPFLRWWGWRAPKSLPGTRAGKWWSFGTVVPSGASPADLKGEWLNWNTHVWSAGK